MARTLSTVTRLSVASVAALALVASGVTSASAIGWIGDVPAGDQPFGIVFAPDGAHAYVTNQAGDSVSVFETTGNTIVDTYASVCDEPKGITISPAHNEIYFACKADNKLGWVNISTGTKGTVALAAGALPEQVAVSGDESQVYITNYGTGTITAISTTTHTIDQNISTQPGVYGIATSPDGLFGYVTNTTNGYLSKLTYSTNVLSGALDLGASTQPRGVAFTPDGTKAYVARSGSYRLAEVDVATFTAADAATPVMGTGSREIAIGPDGRGYVSSSNAVPGLGQFWTFTTSPITLGTATYLGDDEAGVAVNPVNNYAYVAMPQSDQIRTFGLAASRIAGANRYSTAVEISKAAYPSGSSSLVIATGLNYPDALAAGPAAYNLGGPLLLTPPDSLPAAVAAEIARLAPDNIYVVGGTSAVSAAVFNQIKAIVPATERISGANRFETGRKVVEKAFVGGSYVADTVYIATGYNYPDALSAGATSKPVILVDGGASALDAATKALLTTLNPTTVKIVGGTAAVSAAIEQQLNDDFGFSVARLSGANRYATSIAIVADAFGSADQATFATGLGFADALAGTPYAIANGSPLLVVQPDCLAADVTAEVNSLGVGPIVLLGGPAALSDNLLHLTAC